MANNQNMDNKIKIIAPAKVNLFLAVSNKTEGADKSFHPVLNVLHTLLLRDVLYMESEPAAKGLDLHVGFLESDGGDASVEVPQIAQEENIVYKAVMQLAKLVERVKPQKMGIYIEKNIPHQAGLAGGSTDAAAALVGAAQLWGLSKDDKRILQAAQSVGADVAFFLEGGCALYTGAGEILDHKISPINRDVVIVKPDHASDGSMLDGLSTKSVYDTFDTIPGLASDFYTEFPAEAADHTECADEDCECGHDHHNHSSQIMPAMSLMDASKNIVYADGLPLFNNLAPAAESLMPTLVDVREWLCDAVGLENVLLCGSGAATFAIVPEGMDAEEIAEQARTMGWWAINTQLANVRAQVVPNSPFK